jgi:D-alanine-D-alanine ligase
MKKLRVLVVVHASLIPPETLDGHEQKEIDEWRTEYDVTSTLRQMGHEVRCVGVLDSLTELRITIADWKPDIVFNLLEEFDGIVTYDQHVVAFLELLRQPYTGCNPRGLLLSRDKPLSKQLLTYHRIPTPQFFVARKGLKFRPPKKLKYPLFVKSTSEDASLGIAQASVVEDEAKLIERVGFVHEQVKSDALVEEFIEGRELYVGVFGNERLTRLPVWEMVFGSMPDTLAAIATRKVKWDKKYQGKYGITTRAADELPPQVVTQLDKLSRRIYRALGLTGYARMDFRVSAEGQVYVLEANANPNLEAEEDFAESARAAGIPYDDLLGRLMTFGLSYQAEWRAYYG